MSKLIKTIREGAIQYGSLPFWSWNDKLDPEELRRQIRNMRDMQMNGFFMHARGGLETEYLSEEWFDCIKACVDEAKACGMQAWSYDENGWPSGFAGGKLLEDPDNHAVFIEGAVSEDFPAATEATVGIYALMGGKPQLTDAPTEGAEGYLHITMGTDGSYVDTMRRDITEKFLAATHAEYEKRLGEDFGGAMPGFFTDEPQYYRWSTPYSRHMERWFLEQYGYSVKEALPALFLDYEGAEEYRYDYHRMTHEKFTNGFAKPLYEWAEAHGIGITGHYIEENDLSGQMLCCGDIMPQYLYEHIPGIDYLGRRRPPDVAARQLGSVCAQTGRKKALSEMFACCGWDVTPSELKHIAEVQYAGGVNLMCQHLYPYSIRGQRKRDYPAFYSEHSSWQAEQPAFNTYFNHLGCALAMGEEAVDTLVLHPIRSAWLTYRRVKHGTSVAALEHDFMDLSAHLLSHGLPYHFGCESMMRDIATVDGAVLRVGRCAYTTVILPACDTLCDSTVALLRDFIRGGGRVLTYRHHLPCRIDGRRADLSFLTALPDLTDEGMTEQLLTRADVRVDTPSSTAWRDVRMMVRATEHGRLIYLTNTTEKDICGIRVRVKNCGGMCGIDILSLQKMSVFGDRCGEDIEMVIDLYGSEAILLTECEPLPMRPRKDYAVRARLCADKPLTTVSVTDNYLTLDRACVALGDAPFSEERPLERIRDELLADRYRGRLTLRFPFTVRDLPTRLELITEPPITTLTVNGHTVAVGTAHALDRSFRVTDIAPYVKEGENAIDVSLDYYQRDYVYYVLYGGVSETLRNCLVFDTELEVMYLRGDFRLSMPAEDFTRCGAAEDARWLEEGALGLRYTGPAPVLCRPDPLPCAASLTTDGYPYFMGELCAETTVTWHAGEPTVLRVGGRFMTCRVEVNGKAAPTLLFSHDVDLAGLLTEGENRITLRAVNSPRNLFGPHHHRIAEPTGIHPPTFSFEKQWKGGACPDFVEAPSFVDFGLWV